MLSNIVVKSSGDLTLDYGLIWCGCNFKSNTIYKYIYIYNNYNKF